MNTNRTYCFLCILILSHYTKNFILQISVAALKRSAEPSVKEASPKRLRKILPKSATSTATAKHERPRDPQVVEIEVDRLYIDYHQVPERIIDQVKQSRYRQGYILPTLLMTATNQAENAAEALRVLKPSYNDFQRVTSDPNFMVKYFDYYWPAKSHINLENYILREKLERIKAKKTDASPNLTAEKEKLEKRNRRKQENPKPVGMGTYMTEIAQRNIADLTGKENAMRKDEPTTLTDMILPTSKQKEHLTVRKLNIHSFVCLYCSKFFCDPSKFVHHLCYCSICDISYHRGIIDQHYQHIHRSNVKTCEMCYKHFILEAHLTQHQKREHRSQLWAKSTKKTNKNQVYLIYCILLFKFAQKYMCSYQ